MIVPYFSGTAGQLRLLPGYFVCKSVKKKAVSKKRNSLYKSLNQLFN